MTNRNQKARKNRLESNIQNKSEHKEKEKANNMVWTSYLSSIVSIIAIIISLVSLFSQANYADLEYKYKLSPQIDVDGRMDMKLAVDKGVILDIEEPTFEIIQKNNLQKAYLIHLNYEVIELGIDEMENTLKTDWRSQVDMNTANFETNGVQYHYEFILLEGLDESIELYLLYSRSGETNEVGIRLVSGVEMVELEKAHSDDKKYAGERILADKYFELLQNCEKYMM